MTPTPAESAALATGLIYHSPRCTMSKLDSCICLYDARLKHLAKAFEAFADQNEWGRQDTKASNSQKLGGCE